MVDGDWYDTSKSWGGINIQGPASGSFITFHTAAASNTSPSERMRIKSNGDIQFNSNSHTPYIQLVNSGRTEGNPGYSFNNDENTGMFQPAGVADTIAFSTAGTERMRITSAGALEIRGTAFINNNWCNAICRSP